MSAQRRVAMASVFLGLVLLPVLLAPWLAPYPYDEQHRDHPYAPPDTIRFSNMKLLPGNGRLFGIDPPATLFLLGTDAYGRDVFSRLLYGGQISLLAGLLAASLSLSLGLAAGVTAGYFGGWADRILMRGGELVMALPWLYLLLASRALLPLHIPPMEAILLPAALIGMLGWTRPARLIRGVILSGKERGFVLAARGFGAGHAYLIRRHLLPMTAGVVLTQATILIPQFMLAEMALSFLGLGVTEPVPSWGNMLMDARQYHVLVLHTWLLAPAAAAVPVLLGFLLLAEAWREARSD